MGKIVFIVQRKTGVWQWEHVVVGRGCFVLEYIYIYIYIYIYNDTEEK